MAEARVPPRRECLAQFRIKIIFTATSPDPERFQIPAVLTLVLPGKLYERLDRVRRFRVLQKNRDLASHLRRGVVQKRFCGRDHVCAIKPQHAHRENSEIRIIRAERFLNRAGAFRTQSAEQPESTRLEDRIILAPHGEQRRQRGLALVFELGPGKITNRLGGRAQGCGQPVGGFKFDLGIRRPEPRRGEPVDPAARDVLHLVPADHRVIPIREEHRAVRRYRYIGRPEPAVGRSHGLFSLLCVAGARVLDVVRVDHALAGFGMH